MRRLPISVLAILLAGSACARRIDVCPSASRLARRAEMRTLLHEDGTLRARGRALPGDVNFYDPEDIAHHGRWEYFYPGGRKRAEVGYALTCFPYCGTIATTMITDHETGPFRIWYPSGRKLGEGTFAVITRHMPNNCAGGADTAGGAMTDSKWWREDGTEMTLDEARATGLLFAGW